MSVDERAKAGLFLAMQYPVEIPGVSVSNFLRTAKTAVTGEAPALRTWIKDVREAMSNLKIDSTFSERNVNEGFSGGEKKRHEILQLELLKPRFAILDETDSGLDVDALKIVSEGVNRAHKDNDLGVLMITHYTRILKYIKPDFVHVFANGKIVEEGGPDLCWCRQCRRSHVPGPYGWPAEEWSAHQVRSCCKDSWLADGWFCRWRGRDERSGFEKASWVIYGSGYRLTKKTLG